MTLNICTRNLPKLVSSVFKHNETSHFKAAILNILNRPHQSIRLYSSSADVKSDSKQIYYGVLTPQIKAVKFFSFSSSLVGILCQPFLYKAIVSTGNIPIIIAAYSSLGFFTFLTPCLLHFVTKKYVTHLDYKADSNSYVAKTINFFCITKETEFKVDDVVVPDVPGMFTTLIVKGQPFFIDRSLEENRPHYMKIMGFDKPMDYRIKVPPIDKKHDE